MFKRGENVIIKNMIIKDFRKFKEKQEIIFASDNIKNSTLIFGMNSSGKTTIIDAFKWCLYNSSNLPKKFLPNAETVKALENTEDEKVYVEINLIYKNLEYKIKRSLSYFKNSDNELVIERTDILVSYKDESNKEVLIVGSRGEDLINKILPKELLNFIFVNDETLYHIDRRLNPKDILKKHPKSDLIVELEKNIELRSKLNNNMFEPSVYPLLMDEPFEYMKSSDIDSASKTISNVSRQVVLIFKENILSHLSENLKEKTGYTYEISIVDNSPTYSIIKDKDLKNL